MTVHDYAHLSEHRARLERISRRHVHPDATPPGRRVGETLSAVRRTLTDRRARGIDPAGTGEVAHARGR